MLPESLDPLRLAEHAHGHLGWLAGVALLHPALLLRRPQRRAHLAVGLAVALVSVSAAMGIFLYGPYRERLKHGIFVEGERFGWLFERKEHLAFGALVLAWAGAIAYVAAERTADERARPHLRTAAQRAFALACALTLVTATLGTVVASFRSF